MEVWKKWNPLKRTISNLSLKILNDVEALNIIFKDNDEDITFKLEGGWFSYKATNKKAFLKKLEFLRRQKDISIPEHTPLFIVEGSDYLNWLKEESHGVYEYGNFNMQQFVFIGSNLVFEVLATCEPEVVIEKTA